MTTLRIYVPGQPAPQGSKRIINGRVVEMSKKVRPWRKAVDDIVRQAIAEEVVKPWELPIAEACVVTATFYFPRPKHHYKADGKTLRPNAPGYHIVTPDVDKLLRGLLDALVLAGVLADDKYVVTVTAQKEYGLYADGSDAGADVHIRTLGIPDPWSSAHIPAEEL